MDKRAPNNATYYSHPDMYDKVTDALDEFHSLSVEPYIKPLYMLIKVDVDADIVHNQDKAEAYAENHCNRLEYALCDWYYPDEEQFPYIAK